MNRRNTVNRCLFVFLTEADCTNYYSCFVNVMQNFSLRAYAFLQQTYVSPRVHELATGRVPGLRIGERPADMQGIREINYASGL